MTMYAGDEFYDDDVTSGKRVSMEATNSPQTWGTSTLKPVENSDGE